MANIFIEILNMSITASIVIIAVLIIRLLLRKAPKKYSYLLWSVVAFRLCIPYSFQSVFSIFSLSPVDISMAQKYNELGMYYFNADVLDANGSSMLRDDLPIVDNPVFAYTRGYDINALWYYIWLAVMAALILYGFVSYLHFYQQMKTAVVMSEKIYQSDRINSPFILGIVNPKIYIPFGLDEQTTQYVIAHEKYHIKRLDHIVKLFAYLILCVYWFNPLCWLAFVLMSRDMEMSCDEKVLRQNDNIKKAYSMALLSFAAGKHFPSPSPLSFSEGGAKGRIKNALAWKKPKVWLSVIAIIICAAVITACALNPVPSNIISGRIMNNEMADSPNVYDDLDEAISNAVLDNEGDSLYKEYGEKVYEAHMLLGTRKGTVFHEKAGNTLTAYAEVTCNTYTVSGNIIEIQSSFYHPAALSFNIDEKGRYEFNEYWVPNDGADYSKDINRVFPDDIIKEVNNSDNKIIGTKSYDYNVYLLSQSCLNKFIQEENIDVDTLIDSIFDKFESNDTPSSNPYDFFDTDSDEYEALIMYGDNTLEYIYNEFLKGDQYGVRGHIMKAVMCDLLEGEQIKFSADTGQGYFNKFRSHAEELYDKNGLEFMENNAPKTYQFLKFEGYI